MNRKNLYVIVGIALLAAVAVGLIWQSRRRGPQTPTDIRSAAVERGDVLVSVSGSGAIKPARRVDLAFEIGGEVIGVPVDVGDEVQQGDRLVNLDTEQLSLQVTQAEASLAAAEAQLAKLEAGAKPEDVAVNESNLRGAAAQVDVAEAELDQVAAGAKKSDIAAAEADLASAITQQKKAEDWHEATLKCVTVSRSPGDVIPIDDGGVITLTEKFEKTICPLLGVPEEQARYRLQAANQALEAARARLEQTETGPEQNMLSALRFNVAAAVAQRDAAQAQLDLLLAGPTETQIAAVQANVDQARAAVEQAQLALDQAALKAPFEGVVAAINVTVGERAATGIPIVTLIDTSQFHVTIAVDELDVASLAVGQKAEVSFDALPDVVISGTVRSIAHATTLGEGVAAYDVQIDLAPTDAAIRADMTATATVIVEEIRDALKVPTWAIHVDQATGEYYVQRRTGTGVQRVNVKLGARQGAIAQVLAGLSEGDVVVHSPQSSRFDLGARFRE
ncbi:MAG: efflux RND transporter periplasmic adaptor subunit [Chloroflexota bacterium]